MGDENGITVHRGESLARINATLQGCRDRGVQVDDGHLGIVWRGGKIWECDNDGAGGESGDWLFAGTKFEDNGRKNKDSGDGLQITAPNFFEIFACQFLDHPNAAIMLNRLKKSGTVMRNEIIRARHGLGIELCGEWPDGLLIEGNSFEECEYGIFLFGEKPDIGDWGEIVEQILEANTFINCDHDIHEEWG